MKLALFTLAVALARAFDVRLDLRGYGKVEYPKKVKVDVGSRFIVILDENQSTGYSWEVSETYLAANDLYSVLSLIGSDYLRVKTPPGMTGMGGYRTLTFDVIGQGSGDLKLIYSRLDYD
jgi:predicted secreted protein